MRKKTGSAARIPYWDGDYYEKAARRASGMSSSGILGWTGSAVSGMYRAMQDYRRDGELEALLEMQEGLVAAYALLAELRSRHEGTQGAGR